MVSFSSSNDGEEGGPKRSAMTWEQEERDALAEVPRQGSPPAQQVVNALILLNCDAGECNAQAAAAQQVTVTHGLTAQGSARNRVVPLTATIETTAGRLPAAFSAAAGYGSGHNLQTLEDWATRG